MFKMENEAICLWLHKLYLTIINPNRAREAIERTDKFRDPAFFEKAETFWGEVDHLVFDASYLESLDKMQEHLANAKQDLLDILIFRFIRCMIELDCEEGETHFFNRPDIFEIFRQFLIEDIELRSGQWPKH
ncbi:MAG: hypothetical protein GY721_10405 [Deltaproteobacteria bacterium]|nr:hypothetical protein [Deltaproteobacteria bacterium]